MRSLIDRYRKVLISLICVGLAALLWNAFDRENRAKPHSSTLGASSARKPTSLPPLPMTQAPSTSVRTSHSTNENLENAATMLRLATPTEEDIKFVETELHLWLNALHSKVSLSESEMSRVCGELARLLAASNYAKSERAVVTRETDGKIHIEIAADPKTAEIIGEMVYEKTSSIIGDERAVEFLGDLSTPLFNFAHGYGLCSESITLTPSNAQPSSYDMSYAMSSPREKIKDNTLIFNPHNGSFSQETPRMTENDIFARLHYGVLRLVLSKG